MMSVVLDRSRLSRQGFPLQQPHRQEVEPRRFGLQVREQSLVIA